MPRLLGRTYALPRILASQNANLPLRPVNKLDGPAPIGHWQPARYGPSRGSARRAAPWEVTRRQMWQDDCTGGRDCSPPQTAAFGSATMDVGSAAREGGGAADRFPRFGGAEVFSAEEEDRAPARRGVIWPRTRSRRAVYAAKVGRRITQMSDFLPLLGHCSSLRTSEKSPPSRHLGE